MPKSPLLRLSRLLVVPACLVAVLLLSTVARAAGRVVWNNKHPQERDDHSWHLGVKIYMRRAPSIPHIPVKFEFTPKAYYERDLVDGDKIVKRRVPLINNPAIIEVVDIGFLDPGTGKIQKRTKFTFKITRAHDFKAGEYQVKIRDSRSGHLIGRPITLILGGKNKPIDRRTMVFSGNVGKKKAKKKEEMKHVDKNGDIEDQGSGSGDDSASSDDSSGGSDDSASGSDDSTDEPSGDDTEPSGDNGSDDAPPPIKEKPGCNCRIEASHTPADPALLFGALALLGGLVIRRRYR